MGNKNVKFVFWGNSEFSVLILDGLKEKGFLPSFVVTEKDKPKGRGLKFQANPVKVWAEKNKFPALTPEKLDSNFMQALQETKCDIFIAASYGKILPKKILDIPKHGVLNVHPSLLPKYRGSSPVQSAILNNDKVTGVSVILLDEKMDHGPIIGIRKYELRIMNVEKKSLNAGELEKKLGEIGGELLAEIIPKWIAGEIKPVPQDESEAIYTKKIKKGDGLIDLKDNPFRNFLKIQAFQGWPGAYFFAAHGGKKIRVIVKSARFSDDVLKIERVLPEGRKEMNYEDFLRGLK